MCRHEQAEVAPGSGPGPRALRRAAPPRGRVAPWCCRGLWVPGRPRDKVPRARRTGPRRTGPSRTQRPEPDGSWPRAPADAARPMPARGPPAVGV